MNVTRSSRFAEEFGAQNEEPETEDISNYDEIHDVNLAEKKIDRASIEVASSKKIETKTTSTSTSPIREIGSTINDPSGQASSALNNVSSHLEDPAKNQEPQGPAAVSIERGTSPPPQSISTQVRFLNPMFFLVGTKKNVLSRCFL